MPPAAPLEVIIVKEEAPVELVPEQETHDVILADAEPEPSQPHLYNMIMRDYEESLSRMMDDPHELDDPTKAN
jgi:hypothetical protein